MATFLCHSKTTLFFQTNDGNSFVSFNAGALGAADVIHIRSVEYNAPQYGSGAKLICEVNESSSTLDLQVQSGGSGYRQILLLRSLLSPQLVKVLQYITCWWY